MSKPPLGKMYVCTKCGHQALGKPVPHECTEGHTDDLSRFRKATPEDVKETSQAVEMEVMPAGITVPAVSDTTAPDGWENVRRLADFAAKFERCKLACQVMAGFQLIELKKEAGFVQGGLRQKPNNSGFASWEEMVDKRAGISDDTARAWMKMAQGAKPRLKKVLGGDRSKLAGFIDLPVSQWTPEQATQLSEVVHKITDGRTQLEFMFEIGVAKKPQGSGAKGGAKNNGKKLSLEEQLALTREMAREDWTHAEGLFLSAYATKFLVLEDSEIIAQTGALELALKARRMWLDTPKNKRDAQAVEDWLARELGTAAEDEKEND